MCVITQLTRSKLKESKPYFTCRLKMTRKSDTGRKEESVEEVGTLSDGPWPPGALGSRRDRVLGPGGGSLLHPILIGGLYPPPSVLTPLTPPSSSVGFTPRSPPVSPAASCCSFKLNCSPLY